MRSKTWLRYLFYIVLLTVLIFLDGYVIKEQNIYRMEQFKISTLYLLISMTIKISIGLTLGLEHLINEIRKQGRWKVNSPKMILMVIPSLFLSFTYLIMYGYNGNMIYKALIYPSSIFMKNDSAFIYIVQIIFGYAFITSFHKQSKSIKDETMI